MSDTHKAVLCHLNGTRRIVEVRKDNIQDIYDYLGCDVFQSLRPTPDSKMGKQDHELYIDDEGLLKETNPINIWSIVLCPLMGYQQMLCGNILIFGPVDDEGYHTDVTDEFVDQLPSTLRPSPEITFSFVSKEVE